jgi:hypothetical protein
MPEQEALQRPQSKTDLFMSFTILALQGFGGVLAVVQRELVEKKRWMSREQFVEDWAVAQIMPGPNVVNLSLMIGGRYFGLAGALAGLAGMLTAPLLVVLLLAIALGGVSDAAWAQGALRGMGQGNRRSELGFTQPMGFVHQIPVHVRCGGDGPTHRQQRQRSKVVEQAQPVLRRQMEHRVHARSPAWAA